MKTTGNKSDESSPENASEKDRKEAKGRSADCMETVDVSKTNRMDKMSVKNGTAVIDRMFRLSDYHQRFFRGNRADKGPVNYGT